MDLQLKGDRAVVTVGVPASARRSPAGRAEGAAVVVHGRRAEAVYVVVQAMSADGGQAVRPTAHLADLANSVWFISAALAGRRHSTTWSRTPAHSPTAGWDDVIPEDWPAPDANDVVAAVRGIQGFLLGMRAPGWGLDRADRDRRGSDAVPDHADNAASKAARLDLTASPAKHPDRTGIMVTWPARIAVTPGALEFDRLPARRRGRGEDRPKIEAGILTQGPRQPDRPTRPTRISGRPRGLRRQPLAGDINGANLRIDAAATPSRNRRCTQKTTRRSACHA